MTKRDFELIARAIRESCGVDVNGYIATALATTNPRFDRARFLAACRGEDSQDSAGRRVRYSERIHGRSRYQYADFCVCGKRLGHD